MYTEQDLKLADALSRKKYAFHRKMDSDVTRLLTQWGKQKLEFDKLNVSVNLYPDNGMTINVSYLDFGAGMLLHYSRQTGLQFSNGGVGRFSVNEHPYQRLSYMLYAKLLENAEKIESDLALLYVQFRKYDLELDTELTQFKAIKPGCFEQYFESDMFKIRKANQK